MPGAGEQEEPDIEVDKQNGNPQASGAKVCIIIEKNNSVLLYT